MEADQPLAFASSTLKVHTCAKPTEEVLFSSLTVWDLLNLPVDVILELPERLETQCNVSPEFLTTALNPFSVQEIGKDERMKKVRHHRAPLFCFCDKALLVAQGSRLASYFILYTWLLTRMRSQL
jgi:hypothetical protein